MKALLWKDCRVNLFVLVFGIVMLLSPFLTGLTRDLYAELRYGTASWWEADGWVIISLVSLGLSMLTVAMLAGNAMAAERTDRSAEFLAYLPPSRRAVITSKIILALGACLLIWTINLAVIYGLVPLMPGLPEDAYAASDGHPTNAVPGLASTAVVLFGIAWFCSSFLASPAISTGIGIFSPLAVAGGLQAVEYFFHPPSLDFGWWYCVICVGLGILGFVAGTVHYLRRVEP